MTDTLEILGGTPLHGTVRISGAKNEVTKLMVVATLLNKPLHIHNVPDIHDVYITADLLHGLGAHVQFQSEQHALIIDGDITKSEAVFSDKGNRISILLAGPLLHKFGKATIQKPEGCKIGDRPLDLHVYYLRQLGITIEEDDEMLHLRGTLRGNRITFPYKSVGATEGALLAAVHAKGETIIENMAHEPEIVELIVMLQQAGALIEYDAEGTIHVTGVDYELSLTSPVIAIGDRVEAVSYAAAALATKGSVTLQGIDPRLLITALTELRKSGVEVIIHDHTIDITYKEALRPLDIATDPHPAFATDFQQVFAVLLSQAHGVSHIHETVFDRRFNYLAELNKLGGQFSVGENCAPFAPCRFADQTPHLATIPGPMHFHGGEANITDLRAAFGLVMAGLLADQSTTLHNASHLQRGYDHCIDKLTALGAKIKLA